jgi:hypothetical protein
MATERRAGGAIVCGPISQIVDGADASAPCGIEGTLRPAGPDGSILEPPFLTPLPKAGHECIGR